jgi:oligopeptidase A
MGPVSALPAFSEITIDQVVPRIEALLAEQKKATDLIFSQDPQQATWETWIEPLERLSVVFQAAWSPITHLQGVCSTPELRMAYEACVPNVILAATEIEQNVRLYQALCVIEQSAGFSTVLTPAQQQVVRLKLIDARLSGVALKEAEKERYKQCSTALSALSIAFGNQVVDCMDAWQYHTEDRNLLSGLADTIVETARARAAAAGKTGWLLTLDGPNMVAVMQTADHRPLRQAFHYAYQTRASLKGPHDPRFDNTQRLYQILCKRYELARLLSFDHYVDYALSKRMAKSYEEIEGFLRDLMAKTKVGAEKEWTDLQQFVLEHYNISDVKPWDIAYFSEKQKMALFDISDDSLKPYFPMETVFSGLFEVLHRLYGISIRETQEIDAWHPSVRGYTLYDPADQPVGYFLVDLYTRAQKKSGAWMDECRQRAVLKGYVQKPAAYVTCNFTPPTAEQDALLTHHDVLTVFHEFGHAIHHVLTSVDWPSVSGINGVPWDAVELPSQFHENWCWHAQSLAFISKHCETGASLPLPMLQKLMSVKNYQSALAIRRQLLFAYFDLKLHRLFDPHGDPSQVEQILASVRQETSVLPVAEYDCFQNSFTHIFAGGYAAGYYSYLWAEILSANAFDVFAQNGLFDKTSGRRFLEVILSSGGVGDMSEKMKIFCGHAPTLAPFLKQHGIDGTL